jgi:ferritin-like protein
MKSISIHGVDEETEKLIKKRAKTEETSVNKVVKALLAKALGLDRDNSDSREEFMDLSGIWTEDDEKQFFEAIKDLEQIHPEDWQ